jgi:hypothetical protein
MKRANFLIGRGELLTSEIKAPRGGGGKSEVYSLGEAIERLAPQIASTSEYLDSLPEKTCPGDFAVARIIINPSYIAKSYFPTSLLRSGGFVSIGSRAVSITPKKWSKKSDPVESSTTELFIAGKRSSFRNLQSAVSRFHKDSSEAIDFARLESIKGYMANDRLKPGCDDSVKWYEVGCHLLPDQDSRFIQNSFRLYAEELKIDIFQEFNFEAGNLWFVPINGEFRAIEKLANFSFVRTVRPVPKLRTYRPFPRSSGPVLTCTLPTGIPISDKPRVAILDGGLPENHTISSWLGSYRILDPGASDDRDAIEHGLAVTSAFLFGPLSPTEPSSRPFSFVDHLRVLDKDAEKEEPLELYRTLGLIEQALLSRQYEFINLSLGPDLPIEDTDVHAWTSVIDDLLSDGETFMTIAAGNNGGLDWMSGNARVQIPADCVNGVAVGSADCTSASWKRPAYSAIGPGRSPGVIKPDLVAFGGDHSKYFHVLQPGKKASLAPTMGTSFAAPFLLRSAVGIRSILGDDLSPLAIKALLIHTANNNGYESHEVGWGKIQEDVMEIITCQDDEARVVYKGELKPGKFLRAKVPVPQSGLKGMVTLKATFCYACPVDPQDTCSYTRAGLDITFRPDVNNYKEGASTPASKGFFEMKKYSSEDEMRSNAGKWETVVHDQKRMNGAKLVSPVFDIHYNAREGGSSTRRADKIKYALVVSIHAPKVVGLYNEILKSYARILVPIQPEVTIPVQV